MSSIDLVINTNIEEFRLTFKETESESRDRKLYPEKVLNIRAQ